MPECHKEQESTIVLTEKKDWYNIAYITYYGIYK